MGDFTRSVMPELLISFFKSMFICVYLRFTSLLRVRALDWLLQNQWNQWSLFSSFGWSETRRRGGRKGRRGGAEPERWDLRFFNRRWTQMDADNQRVVTMGDFTRRVMPEFLISFFKISEISEISGPYLPLLVNFIEYCKSFRRFSVLVIF